MIKNWELEGTSLFSTRDNRENLTIVEFVTIKKSTRNVNYFLVFLWFFFKGI